MKPQNKHDFKYEKNRGLFYYFKGERLKTGIKEESSTPCMISVSLENADISGEGCLSCQKLIPYLLECYSFSHH